MSATSPVTPSPLTSSASQAAGLRERTSVEHGLLLRLAAEVSGQLADAPPVRGRVRGQRRVAPVALIPGPAVAGQVDRMLPVGRVHVAVDERQVGEVEGVGHQ